MKKGLKLAALLLGLVLVIPACNLGGSSSKITSNDTGSNTSDSQSSEPAANYVVTISNKEQLQAEWFVGELSRKVEIATEPKANVAQLIKDGAIQITSSNDAILSINGQMATPVAAGEATIKVKCGESEDTVALTLKAQQTIQEKYEVAHAGTAEDPLTNEEALKIAKSDKYSNEDLHVGGIISSFYHAPGSRTDGAVSYFLTPAEGETEKFEVYKCYKDGTGAASYLTDDDIWVGGYAVAHGTFTVYGTQYETTSAKFVKCEGNKPQPRQTIEKSFAEVLAIGNALTDGDSAWDYYKFEGYVTKKSGNNFFLTATKGEALVPGKSDAAHGEADIVGTNAIELYNAGKVDALAAILLDGAKVRVTMIVKNYHGTIENGLDLTAENVELIEAGAAWAVPEPTVETRTLKQFIDGENTKTKAYNVTAQIKAFKSGATKDKYGNMTLTDGTNDLIIYGSSATATALAWDNAESYAFNNPQDFLTNEVTSALSIGNEITMKLIRADFTDKNTGAVTIEGTGIITSVKTVEATAIALDKATAEIEAGERLTLTASLTPSNSNSKVTWISSDEAVATVENGLVTGVAAGTATIIAKVSDAIKAECVVTVKAAAEDKDFEVDFYAKTAKHNAYNDTWTYGDVTVSGGSNNNGGWTFVKMGGKSATISADGYPGTYIKTNKAVAHQVASVTFKFVGKCYNQDNEKAVVKVESYSDAALATKVAETDSKEVPAITTDNGVQEVTLSFATAQAANLYYKVVFDITNTTTYNGVVALEKITFNSEADDPQPEIAQPVGEFHGVVKLVAAAGGKLQPVDMFLTADSATLWINGEALTVSSYEWDKVNGAISIVTSGDYGTVSAIYDAEKNTFTVSGVTGTNGAYVDSAYPVTLHGNALFYNCDGTTAELQEQFDRRFYRNGTDANWVYDTFNADKISKEETIAVQGSSAKLRAISAGASNRNAICLKSDFAEARPTTTISFWVYNAGAADVTLRSWGYTAANKAANFEYVNIDGSGSMVAKAGAWTFITMTYYNAGVAQQKNIYNFQIADMNSTQGEVLYFDNICLL